jgi:type I restriction enzyme S subunit
LDRWIIHYLNFADLLPYVSGLTVPKLNQANLRAIPVPSASLDEQVRVLAILDEGFAAIATARANTEQNLRAARAVFESHLESVFAQRGDGWDSLTELEYLTDPKSPITYGVVKPGGEGNVTFIRGGDLAQGRILTAQLRTITQEVSEQYKRTLLRGGELLISLVGQPGQLAVVPMELAGANIARQVGLIRLQALVHPEFARLFLQSPAGQSALGARQSGSVQQVINLGELKQVRIPVPSLTIQTKVVEALAAANLQTERLASIYRRKLAALDALKQSLLHQAFTGAL